MDKKRHEELLQSKDVLLELVNNSEMEDYQKEAFRDILEHFGSEESPLGAYFKVEAELLASNKSLEIKSAMVWGALSVVHKMDRVDWDNMRLLYGEFMSHQMSVR